MEKFFRYAKKFILAVVKWTVLVIVGYAILYGCGIVKTLSLSSLARAEFTGLAGVVWGMIDQLMAEKKRE